MTDVFTFLLSLLPDMRHEQIHDNQDQAIQAQLLLKCSQIEARLAQQSDVGHCSKDACSAHYKERTITLEVTMVIFCMQTEAFTSSQQREVFGITCRHSSRLQHLSVVVAGMVRERGLESQALFLLWAIDTLAGRT